MPLGRHKDDPLRNPKNFLFKAWRSLALSDPSPLQYDFIEYLNDHRAWQQIREESVTLAAMGSTMLTSTGTGARKILMAFRGAAKTYVCTTNAVYRLRENPLEEVLVVSATDGFASAISTMAWKMVTEFEWLAGDMAPSKEQRQSALAFDVRGARLASKDASFTARGIFGQITGLRATCVLGDDLETPNTSETEVKRTQLRHRMAEIPGAIIKPGGDIFLLGTPQNEMTVYKEWADEKGFELSIYPILFPRATTDPKTNEMLHYGTRLSPFITRQLDANPMLAGTSTEPQRFDEADIAQRQQAWGKTEFERQFKMWMDAGAGRAYPLKLRDLIVFDISPPMPGKKVHLPSVIQWAPLHPYRIRDIHVDGLAGDGTLFGPMKMDVELPAEEVIGWIDTSGEGEDETTWTILAGLAGRVYLLWQGSSREGHTEATMKAIAKDFATWGVQQAFVEANFGGGMFATLLKPHLQKAGAVTDVEDIPATRIQKEVRIVNALEPLMTSHRLVVNTGVFRQDFDNVHEYKDVIESRRRFYRLTYQLTRMTKLKGAVKFNDRADGLGSGVVHFADRLQRALDHESNLSKEQALQREAQKIIDARIKAGLPVAGWLPDEDQGLGFGRTRAGQGAAPSSQWPRTQ